MTVSKATTGVSVPRTADGGLLRPIGEPLQWVVVERDANRFQCRERLMGDCYLAGLRGQHVGQTKFQCRERLMGDCYTNPAGRDALRFRPVSVPRTADGGLLLGSALAALVYGALWFQCRERLMGDCYWVGLTVVGNGRLCFSAANG